MNTKQWLGIGVVIMMLVSGAAFAKGGKPMKKARKTEKMTVQKCNEQHKKDAELCKAKKGKDAEKCKKAAQVKKDKCVAALKK